MTVIRFGNIRTFNPLTSRPNIKSDKHYWGFFSFFSSKFGYILIKQISNLVFCPLFAIISHIPSFYLQLYTFSAKHVYISPPPPKKMDTPKNVSQKIWLPNILTPVKFYPPKIWTPTKFWPHKFWHSANTRRSSQSSSTWKKIWVNDVICYFVY